METVASVSPAVTTATAKPAFRGQVVHQTFTGLPPKAQGIIAVALVATAIAVGYKLWHAPAKIKEGEGQRHEERDVNQEYDKLVTTGTKPTLTNSQMSQYANQLFQAMDGYGTTEATILSVFRKLKNDADFLGVNKAYGRRTVSSGRLNPEPDLKNATLAEAITSELDDWYINEANKILKNNKIKYNFA